MKPRSKPTLWPTTRASPTNFRSCSAASFGLGAPLTSLSVMPCIWLPTIERPGFTRVDELGALDLDGPDLEEVGHLGIRPGRLDVDDDELALGVGVGGEVEDRADE